jgi:hypothetical protein
MGLRASAHQLSRVMHVQESNKTFAFEISFIYLLDYLLQSQHLGGGAG